MRRLLFISIFFLSNFCFAQNYNWITPNKDYLKLYISDDGLYRINKIDFTNAGVNTGNIDPRTVKVFYKGSQIPIYFLGEEDGIFNDSDYFDFYSLRNYGGLTNTYKESGGSTILDYTTNEYFNLYSDTSIYWIDWGGTFGLRYINYNFSTNLDFPQSYFLEKIHFEKDLIYSLGETFNPSTDFRYFNTEKVSGEGWYWKEMQLLNTITDTFRTPQLSIIPQTCSLKLFAYPNNNNPGHRLIIRINSTNLDTLKRANYNKFDTTIFFSSSLLSATTVNQISVKYITQNLSDGYLYFDYFTISYPKNFTFEDSKLSFKSEIQDSTSRKFKISGFQNNEINIYDIKNGFRIANSLSSYDTIFFTGKGNGDFEIVNKYITKKPFRIKKKQVPNLVSPSNGTDYLIIYNKLFESQAEQLRAYRNSHDNFRSFKAEVEDIYDIFNYGMESPDALRAFVKYVYNNWSSPSVKFICLFGRGSLDPKKNLSSSIYYQNLIPVYGNPPSDGYFANLNIGSFVYYPQISIGRIPVYTSQEAQDVVNKIISYENNPLDTWIKKFNFITGGFTASEQTQFITSSNNLINSYINSPPIVGYPIRIYRTDTSGQVSYSYEDSIKNVINNGNLIVNYIGHAATTTWDNGIRDPNILSNGIKTPLILSMTCFTGKNAHTDADRGFGEKFLFLPNKGAVGFIGTTGWSFFPGGGNTLNDLILKSFSRDSLRRIGDILRYAQIYFKNIDTISFANKNTINSYNLIGDPASKLLMPTYPEFDIQMSDYKMIPVFPTLKEQITIRISPKNFGTRADSCKIRFQLLKNNLSNRITDTIIRNFDFVDSISYSFRIDSAGIYSMKIILDVDNWYVRESKTNNSIIIPIPLKNISFVPLKPIDNSIVHNDSVIFVGINPNIDPKKNILKLFVQLDTSMNFNSSLNQTYFKVCDSGVITKFKIRIPILDSTIVYFWRTNSVINNTDTSGWTMPSRFLYYPVFKNEDKNVKTNNDSIINIYKKYASQYNQIDLNNTIVSSDGIKLRNFTGDLFAQSWGGDPWEASYFRVNGKEIFLLDPDLHWGGLNIIKVRKNDGVYVELKHFKFSSPTSSDSVINYLNTFNNNYILMLSESVPVGVTDSMSFSLKNKFKEFGSTYVDSVRMNVWGDRWSFISYPTGTGYIVSEKYLNSNIQWSPAISSMQPQFQFDSGFVYNNFGPAAYYKNFSWNYSLFSNSSLTFDVFGIDNNNQSNILYTNITSSNFFNLDTVSTSIYPNLLLKTKFNVDSLNGYNSPVLKSLTFNYIPPAELISDNYSFIKSDSVVLEGDTVKISVKYFNVGFIGALTTINTWSASSPSGIRILKVDTLNSLIKVDSSVRADVLVNTGGLRNRLKPKDTVYIYFESKLRNTENEFYTYNNTAITTFILTGDSIKPSLNVTYDGIRVQNGDFIQAKPIIEAKYLDNSKMQISDTSNIKVYLDTNYVPYFIGGIKNPEIDLIFPTNSFLQATVVYKPLLSEGLHDFMFVSFDKSGNYADTVRYLLTVNPEMKIFDLNTFPNPMKNHTNFIFNLSGSSLPNYCKIKIFTIAGRLVKTINFPANIGFNNIPWDGRDEDGDYMANGVYLYRLIIEGNSKKETAIQKLVILK